jgi:hypothetical protein
MRNGLACCDFSRSAISRSRVATSWLKACIASTLGAWQFRRSIEYTRDSDEKGLICIIDTGDKTALLIDGE